MGLENIVVVETDDAILILPKERTQDVKNIYESLEKEKSTLIE
ncbi:MAG: hypothetical protein RBR97_12895 [Bacteroidales bacterium]|nr:hypothetical protein [Bacteroidales bacterium]